MSLAIHPLCHNQLRQSLWTILFAIFCPWLVSLSSRSSVFDVILRVELWYCRSTEIFIKQALSHCLPDAVGDRNCGALASANRTIRFKLIRVLSVEPNTARTLIICVKVVTYTEFHAQHSTGVSNAWNWDKYCLWTEKLLTWRFFSFWRMT